jgi:ribosomal protein L29
MAEARTKANALESSSKFQVQRQLEETVDKLKRELVETRSKNEIVHLNFETEEDHRKKKIERLEKELETVKQQVSPFIDHLFVCFH